MFLTSYIDSCNYGSFVSVTVLVFLQAFMKGKKIYRSFVVC
uniref:Uncharacterized protein n=1 Tax=Arundo donax TaxID=35708 RepID=A0A0A9GL84_ARUDO